MIEALDATKLIIKEYKDATTRPIKGVNDHRVIPEGFEHSVGIYILRIAGIIAIDSVEKPAKYAPLRDIYNRYYIGGEFDNNERACFIELLIEL